MDAAPQILRFLLETDDEEDLVKDAGYHPSTIQVDLGGILWAGEEETWQHHAPDAYRAIVELWSRGLQFNVESRPAHQGPNANKMNATFSPERHAADVDMWFAWDAHETVMHDIYGVAADDEELEVFDEIQMEVEQWMTEHNFSEDGTWHIVRTVEASELTLAEELASIMWRIDDLENALIEDEDRLAKEFGEWAAALKRERGLA